MIKALIDGLSGCAEWDDRSAGRVRNDPDLQGWTPEGIKKELIRCVRRSETVVEQRLETRERWRDDYRYYYVAILPIELFRHGLFVEMRITDADDPDFPVVALVNAHPQKK